MRKVDQHFHSKKSDWLKDSFQILDIAKSKWMKMLCPADHDIINSTLTRLCRANWIESYEWTEVTCNPKDEPHLSCIHLLGYSTNFWERMINTLSQNRKETTGIMMNRVDRFQELWFVVNKRAIIEMCEGKWFNVTNITYWHLAYYFLKWHNYEINNWIIKRKAWKILNVPEFVNTFLRPTWELYKLTAIKESWKYPDIRELWEIITKDHGLMCLAHPWITFAWNIYEYEKFVKKYRELWLWWIEISLSDSPDIVKKTIELSRRLNMVLTFWSDAHFAPNWQGLWELNISVNDELIDEHLEKFRATLTRTVA